MTCDNTRAAHDPQIIGEDDNALRVQCRECKTIEVIRKDWRGVPENRQYARFYKRDILQGNDNLLYKYYPQHLNV